MLPTLLPLSLKCQHYGDALPCPVWEILAMEPSAIPPPAPALPAPAEIKLRAHARIFVDYTQVLHYFFCKGLECLKILISPRVLEPMDTRLNTAACRMASAQICLSPEVCIAPSGSPYTHFSKKETLTFFCSGQL